MIEGEDFMARQEFPLEQQLRKDIQDAQRARDQVKLDTLRMALGAIHNLEVARTDRKHSEYGQPLTEADTLKVLEQEIKKRSQAIVLYKQGGRNDLVEKEQREMDILQSYLQSSQLSDEEVRAIVERLVAEQGKEFRRVMPLAIKETKGKAEGARVQRIVKELTQ
ncbi:GatB/YqeY domain-containing protein [Ktedonosporobacter rubrisoli]|uniref:GatB/YqeY domain-containing protein n=2 Tax=Ktedonosporobacter rubrisoli TaxID=2509675 RepID=A0A4P6JSW0_KTERU|nr:GatB/YqeY domain-containing protein [Ktedonosporobacter rubrisoli]